MSDIGKELREKNKAKFNDFQASKPGEVEKTNSAPLLLPGFGADLTKGSDTQRSGAGFGSEAMVESPFAADHFNSKLLGIDLGEVIDINKKNSLHDQFNQDIDFDKIRAEHQSAFTKMGALTTQFVGKTAVGTVGNIVGGFYGLGKAAIEGDSSQIFDNDFYRSLDEMTEGIEAKNTVFVSGSDGIGFNAGTAKNLSDAFSFIAGAIASEAIMQTAGNLVGGAGVATWVGRQARYMSQLGKLVKMFDKTLDTEKAAIRAANLAESALDIGGTVDKMSKFALIENATSSLLQGGRRLMTTTGYEASMEARGAKDDYIQSMTDNMEYYLDTSNMSEEEKDAYRRKKQVDFERDANSAGMMTFALNTGMLSVSNAIQFPQIFGNSLQKGVKMGGVIRKGISEIGMKEGKKAAIQRGFSTAGRILKSPFTEFMEETGQGVASNYAKNHYEVILGDQTDAGILAPRANNVAESLHKALSDTYGTREGWHEGIIGAIVGAVGIPGMRKVGKKYKGTWNGGIVGDVREMNNEKKAKQEYIANVNARKQSDLLEMNKNSATRASVGAQAEDVYNIANNKIALESSRDNKIYQYTTDYMKKGMSDFIQQDIDEISNLASNDIEKYREIFGKDETFTKEEALAEANNFREKTNLYRDAYNKVHRHFNLNLMRTDEDSQKLTDTLVYAVADQKIMTDRLKEVESFLYDMKSQEFTDDEIKSLLEGSKKYGALSSKFEKYVASKNRERGKITPEEAEQRREAVRAQMDSDFINLLEEDTTALTKQMEELKKAPKEQDPEAAEKTEELIANYEKAISLKEDYDAIDLDEKLSPKITPFDDSKSGKAKAYKKAVEDFIKQNKESGNRAMNEISRPGETVLANEMREYLYSKNAFAAKFNKQMSNEAIFDKNDKGYDSAEDLMQEIDEISDRLLTATHVAGYLYGFKDSPHKAINAILSGQLWQDLDNAQRLGSNMDLLMETGQPDATFTSMKEEFDDLVEHMDTSFERLKPMIRARFNDKMYKELVDDIAQLKVDQKKYEEYIGVSAKKDEQEKTSTDSAKTGKKETKKEDPKPVVPDDSEDADHLKDLANKIGGKPKKRAATDYPSPAEETENTDNTEDPDAEKEEPEPKGNTSSKAAKAKTKIQDRKNRMDKLTIREGSFDDFQSQFSDLLEKGEIKNKAAVTIQTRDEAEFDPDKNEGLTAALIRDSHWEPAYDKDSNKNRRKGSTLLATDVIVDDNTDQSQINGAKKMTVNKVFSEDATGVNAEVEILNEDGTYELKDLRLVKKEDLLASYKAGYKKFLASKDLLRVSDPASLDHDIYTFVRYVPMSLKIYDKIAPAKGNYDFEIGAQDKTVYTQEYFFAADDILKNEIEARKRHGEMKQALEESRKERAAMIKNVTRNSDRTKELSRIRNAFDKQERDIRAKYEASGNNGLSNFNYRLTTLRRKYVAKKPVNELTLRVHHVDQGNIQHHSDINAMKVEDRDPTELGYDPKTMTLDDIWYGNQYNQYVRIDGTKSHELDEVDPFLDMAKQATNKSLYFKKKNKAGKTIPIKMGVSKLGPKFTKIFADQIDKFWDEGQSYTVKNTKIPFVDNSKKKYSLQEFIGLFVQSRGDGSAKDSMYLDNVVNIFEKDGNPVMQFSVGGVATFEVTSKEMWEKKKKDILPMLMDVRMFVNKNALVDVKKGADDKTTKTLRNDVLKYYFDSGIISHSFDIENNFDDVYSRKIGTDSDVNYKRGIVLSMSGEEGTQDSENKGKKEKEYGKVLTELKKSLTKDPRATLYQFSNTMIHEVVFDVHKKRKDYKDLHGVDPSEAVFSQMIEDSVQTTVDKSLKKIEASISLYPNMQQGINHDTQLEILQSDKPFDKLLRTVHAFKKHAEKPGFKTAIRAELDVFGAKSTIVQAFKAPKRSISFNRFQNAEAKLDGTPHGTIHSIEQFDAALTTIKTLEKLLTKEKYIDIKYSEDSANNKENKDWSWEYTDVPASKKLSNKNVKTRVYKVLTPDGWPTFNKDTGEITGATVKLQVGTMKKNELTGVWEPGKNVITLFQDANKAYDNNNIVTDMFIPFLEADGTLSSKPDDLEVDSKKRNKIRDKNINTVSKGIISLTGQDYLGDERAANLEKGKPTKFDDASDLAGDIEDTVQAEKEKQSKNTVHVSNRPSIIDRDAYEGNPIRIAVMKMLVKEMKNHETFGKEKIEKLVKMYKKNLGIESAEELVQVIEIYKEEMDIPKDYMDYVEAVFGPLCKIK